MYRVLIVDDEIAIRDGLRSGVKWNNLGFVVDGCASDGAEALRQIETLRPHVVVSDIRMPRMDGIELMRLSLELDDAPMFIFISGHEEFEHVQNALRLGAVDYILKPLEIENLSLTLTRLRDNLDQRSRSSEDIALTREARSRILLQSAVMGIDVSPALQHLDNNEKSHLTNAYYMVLSVQVDRFYDRVAGMGDESQVRSSFFQLIEHARAAGFSTVLESTKEFVACVQADGLDDLEPSVTTLCGRLHEAARSAGFTITTGYSEPRPFDALKSSLAQARSAVSLRVVKGADRPYSWRDLIDHTESEAGVYDSTLGEELVAAATAGDDQRSRDLSDRLVQMAARTDDPRATVLWVASRVIAAVERVASQRGQSIEEAVDDPFSQWSMLQEEPTIASMVERFYTILSAIARYTRRRQDHHTSQILDQAVEFLHRNFNDPGTTLSRVAEEACMSPCYFSVVFKDVMGINFQQYLVNFRMDRAKDLLANTSLKTYEISNRIGYENSSYFSTAFKRVVGMSPSEYRSQNLRV